MAFGLHSKLLTPREPAGRGSLSGTPLAARRTSQAIIALAIEAHHFETRHCSHATSYAPQGTAQAAQFLRRNSAARKGDFHPCNGFAATTMDHQFADRASHESWHESRTLVVGRSEL